MRFEVGDKVKVKPLEWYNHNCNEYGDISGPSNQFTAIMKEWCGKVMTITEARLNNYKVKENNFNWTVWMLEDCKIRIRKR